MLRVYSILYIEKLWTTSASPALKGMESSHSSVLDEEMPVLDEEISVLDAEVAESSTHLVGVPEEEEQEYEEEEIYEEEEGIFALYR